MPEPIISVSGLRGIIGESLDPILAIRYCTAFASLLESDGPIVVTRDGRATGSMLAQAICSGLSAAGRDVLYGNVAATPTTGILVREFGAVAGIQISASHNPPPYNGIKLFGQDGRVIPADQGEQVIEAYRADQRKFVAHDHLGAISDLSDTTSAHLAKVLATVNVDAIREKNYNVVLDSNHGSGAVLGRLLLEALNCNISIVGETPDGIFEHPPEPTEANLQMTVQRAEAFQADAVFCQDPDADRLALIDEKGRYVGEEYTLALTLDHALQTRNSDTGNSPTVVINCSSSRMSNDICARHGAQLHLSAVGEANVTNEMIRLEAVYGGEGNGGPIDPRVGYVRDSFVGMAQVLDAMTSNNATLSELAANIPGYDICKTKIEMAREQIPSLYEKLESEFSDAKISKLDGVRFDWEDAWMLVRPSNTEPIVRAIAEAPTLDRAQELCERAASLSGN